MKIISREQIPLSLSDIKTLSKVRRKKTLFMLKAYLALNGILILIYLTGIIKPSGASVETVLRYQRATYILTGASFILFTCIFLIHYFRSVYPYTLDLKRGLKTISWFYPASYKTPFFENYFLKTGSRKKPMLAIPKHLYQAIEPGVLACIIFAPASRFLLLVEVNGLGVEFNEENSGLDQ
jgi:hypothetical protein